MHTLSSSVSLATVFHSLAYVFNRSVEIPCVSEVFTPTFPNHNSLSHISVALLLYVYVYIYMAYFILVIVLLSYMWKLSAP